ncbi:putative C2H2 finger domain protein [Aspergillus clavatus NRRL 1]|uniref:C2H2 finger domain protein, putative n=1 Tax=Aspergillus clavatus (strain ATCC 1007 / CBS 513.65 / DSM 816 / NCTC 3887 / NRRL 1 / QM 1276 / 107) TaxID=344612 RepID=A1C7Y6_ASPCL|nr:C2H2 finger domain protein, putative [Aspergillus clavatus NRRL 1]EAW14507.1 C2H2 finger domain protein, putative [Aspergillus clavatus NRRL 1]
MSGPATPRKTRCTFPNCPRLFDSVEEMKRHKRFTPEHEYCSRCDEDFQDEQRLLIHKIKSNKHIVCPICGIDFRSEGGRDVHIRQNHRAEQNLECYGCKAHFKSASSMMRHIEDDECPGITRARLLQEKSKKLIIKQALKVGEGSPMPIIPGPSDNDDIDGGVKVDPNPLEYDNREAMAHQPKLGEHDPTASVSAMLALKHWPQPPGRARAAVGAVPVELMAFSELAIVNGTRAQGWKGKEPLRAIQESAEQEENQGHRPFGVAATFDAGQTLRTLQSNWDATNFFNSYSGEYVCPCGARFNTMKEFEEHMIMKSQGGRGMQCPGCQKFFKTTAALVAHCESASTRCYINDNHQFGQIIDEMTGGLIQAAGYNPDGTVKYEAGKLDLTNATTIGVDASKFKR